jgi:cardiolipin synthase
MDLSAFNVIAIIAIAFLSLMLFLALFEPGLPYTITRTSSVPIDSEEFLHIIEALSDAQVHPRTLVEVLTNGEVYYEAELDAISKARNSINIEAYIFQKGVIASRFVKALAERARAGVQVNIVLDAIGSFATWNSYFKELREAGGRVCWYHPLKWYTLPRINNRTHRERIVSKPDRPRWRDTMFRVEGCAVSRLQATFAENWLEASGEILIGKDYFPFCEADGTASALVVDSSPTAGMSTRARMLYQTLLASAQESILITTPYFLPDRSARREMVRAIRERGVAVKIITPARITITC